MNPKSIIKKQIEQLPGIESVELICVEPETSDHVTIHVYFDPESIIDRLTPEEVAQRNYNATVRRGLINDKTKIMNFFYKLKEEIYELKSSYRIMKRKAFDPSELADISLVCDAMALHYGIDLQAKKERKMKFNELRK